jgi:hypothetical protein
MDTGNSARFPLQVLRKFSHSQSILTPASYWLKEVIMKMTETENLSPEQELNRISYFRAVNRRSFLTGIGAAGAAAGAAMVLGCTGTSNGNINAVPPVVAGSPQPADVLNFALNLEYLEASFYLYAVTGQGLAAADMGSGAGTVSGGVAVKQIAQQIAADEQTHVQILRSALGSAAVAMPSLNLAALGSVNNMNLFLLVARAFEDTGVSAYLGAAGYLAPTAVSPAAGTTPALQTAAQILAIEAYHASNIRQNIIQLGLTAMDKATDSMDVPTSNMDPTTGTLASGTHQYFCEMGGLAIVRTPQQVLNIVYATPGTGITSGGFYPMGLNGTIKST